MTIEAIKECISNWNAIRDTEQGFNLLTSGSVTELTRDNYNALFITTSQTVHYYIGAERIGVTNDYNPIFFLVGAEYDTSPTIDLNADKIVPIRFKTAPFFIGKLPEGGDQSFGKNLDPDSAWGRAFKWMLYGKDWFELYKSGSEFTDSKIVKSFTIPNNSLMRIFQEENDAALLFFGIKYFESDKNPKFLNLHNIDIVICNATTTVFEMPIFYENLTMPCPPYNCGEFALTEI
jgi:hypothetical protein